MRCLRYLFSVCICWQRSATQHCRPNTNYLCCGFVHLAYCDIQQNIITGFATKLMGMRNSEWRRMDYAAAAVVVVLVTSFFSIFSISISIPNKISDNNTGSSEIGQTENNLNRVRLAKLWMQNCGWWTQLAPLHTSQTIIERPIYNPHTCHVHSVQATVTKWNSIVVGKFKWA